FKIFVESRRKRLKRLTPSCRSPHRAKAPVLMRGGWDVWSGALLQTGFPEFQHTGSQGEWPALDTQRGQNGKGRIGVLINHSDEAVAAEPGRQADGFEHFQSRPHQPPRHGYERNSPAECLGNSDEDFLELPGLR